MTPDAVRAALARAKIAVEERREPLPPVVTEAHVLQPSTAWTFQAIWRPPADTRLRRVRYPVRVFGDDFDPSDLWVTAFFVGSQNMMVMAMWEGENFIGNRDYHLVDFAALNFDEETPGAIPVSVTVENRGSNPRVLALEFHADAVDDPIRKVYRAANLLREIERAQARLSDSDPETLALLDVVLEHQEAPICAVCKNAIDIASVVAA